MPSIVPTGYFVDLRNTFIRHPVTNDVAVVRDEDSVKSALMNLMYTERFERPSRPGVGAGLRSLLFELQDATIVHKARTRIREAFDQDPRAELSKDHPPEIRPDPDNNSIHIRIPFFQQNVGDLQLLDFTLERTVF